ncbi:MAG: PKD domain-containing protein [Candidatus Thermoplasmatota archaeon]|nr:PKD domain-containing protein [Candidatus Thermoplasmatota archaeon]
MREKILHNKTTGKSAIGAVFCIVILFASLATAIDINGEQNTSTTSNQFLSYSFLFAEPKAQTTYENNHDYTLVEMKGCLPIGKNAGEPMMPVKPISLLLPPMTTVSDIQVVGTPVEFQIDDLKAKPIFPYQNPVPFGQEPGAFVVNDNVYSVRSTYPGYLYDQEQIGYSHGYTILSLNLHPLQYNPGAGTVAYYQEMTVNIRLKQATETTKFYQNNLEDRAWVESLVYNADVLDTYTSDLPTFGYPGGLCDPSGHYDFVIITTTYNSLNYWATSGSTPYNWNSLMDYHLANDGLASTVVTVQDINACTDYQNANPLFNDQQAHIREFCKDAYQDWETRYILIAGDGESSYIPARDMDTNYETDIDADIYWSNLDNNFNADSDNYWGEEGDTGFDLYSEMYIGRITCDIPQDVSNWIKKVLYYGTSYDLDYLDNAGFYGGDTGWSCQGDDFMDYSAVKGTIDWLGPDPHHDGPFPSWVGMQFGFETWNAKHPENDFNITHRWTADPPNPGWQGGSESAAIAGFKNAINNNEITIASGIAHADPSMSLDVYASSWESQYTNTKPFFLHDYGCHCGDFDDADDGVLHSMLFHSDTELAFGVVYNTCYGWGNLDCTNSSSAFQAKEFWSYFLDLQNKSGSLNAWQLGKGHAYSKDRMAPTINWDYSYGTWRAIIQGCLLFGDPALKLKIGQFSNPPAQPTLNGPTQGVYNQNMTYTAVTTEPDGEPIYYQFDWGFGEMSGWYGPYTSGEEISVTHSWAGIGSYIVKVVAKDNKSSMSEWSVGIRVQITDNTPPAAPEITGPSSGKVGQTYDYTVSAVDPNDHSICYRINWGESGAVNWSTFYPSGEDVVFSHAFQTAGTLRIQVQAMDEMGYLSEWTVLEVTMPKNLAGQSLVIQFLQNHPLLYRLLQLLAPQLGL